MGLFSKRVKHVQVAFRGLDRAHLPIGGGTAYTYAWPLKGHPNIGDWVVVPGGDGRDATAVIVATNTTPPRGMRIANVIDRVPAHEVEQAKTANISRDKQRTEDTPLWLDMMRAKAGLQVDRKLPTKPPEGLPAIPPVKGTVIGQPAYDRGRVWMRAHHRARELNRPTEEVELFKTIAEQWYARGRKRKK